MDHSDSQGCFVFFQASSAAETDRPRQKNASRSVRGAETGRLATASSAGISLELPESYFKLSAIFANSSNAASSDCVGGFAEPPAPLEPESLESAESTTPLFAPEDEDAAADPPAFALVVPVPDQLVCRDDSSLSNSLSNADGFVVAVPPLAVTPVVAPVLPSVVPPLSPTVDWAPDPVRIDCNDDKSAWNDCGLVPLKLSPTSKLTFGKFWPPRVTVMVPGPWPICSRNDGKTTTI